VIKKMRGEGEGGRGEGEEREERWRGREEILSCVWKDYLVINQLFFSTSRAVGRHA
jgi:hypothetical protein